MVASKNCVDIKGEWFFEMSMLQNVTRTASMLQNVPRASGNVAKHSGFQYDVDINQLTPHQLRRLQKGLPLDDVPTLYQSSMAAKVQEEEPNPRTWST